MTDKSSTFEQAFVAEPEDRFFAPIDPLLRNAKRRFVALVIAVCLLHIGLLVFLLLRDHSRQEAAPKEIPVEVVVVPPPQPKPEPKKEEAKQKPQPKEKAHLEKPATDTPPPPNNEKLRAEQSDKATQSPVNGKPEPNAAMKPMPTPEKPAPTPATADAARTAAPDQPEEKPDAEPLNKAAPVKDSKPTQKQKPVKAKPPVPARDRASLAREFAALSQSPNFSIAVESKPSPVNGGKCHTNPYLCTLYGLIMRQQHYPDSARARHIVGTVVVAFWVDERGDLVHQALYRTSGHPELDAEAVATIHRAAPFPPPPPGSPHGFIAQMEFPPK